MTSVQYLVYARALLTTALLTGQFIGRAHAISVEDAATPALKASVGIELSPCTLPNVTQGSGPLLTRYWPSSDRSFSSSNRPPRTN